MIDLLRELVSAHTNARTPELAEALQACGFQTDGVPIWGVEFVEVAGDYYQPRHGGHPAIVVPVFRDGELIDLTATGLATRRTVIRMGFATMLGQEASLEGLSDFRQPSGRPATINRVGNAGFAAEPIDDCGGAPILPARAVAWGASSAPVARPPTW